MSCRTLVHCAGAVVIWASSVVATAQDHPAKFAIAEGKFELTAPKTWVRKQPRTRIVEQEFAIPAAEGDKIDGRLTVMGAGGSIEANIDRWFGQFSQPDGSSTRERAKIKQIKVAGQDVHLVEISGNFRDQRGPAAPAVERPNFRMLAAIISTNGNGNYFVKLYGPNQTIAENERAFVEMIEGLKQN